MYVLRQINRYKLSSNLLAFYGLEDETTVKERAMTGFVFSFLISCNSLLKITSLELLLCIIIKETTYHFTNITTTIIVIQVVYYT